MHVRNCYGNGPLSINMAGAVNSNLKVTRLLIFFDEVFHYCPDEHTLDKDVVGDEILETMYSKGVLDPKVTHGAGLVWVGGREGWREGRRGGRH